MLTEVSFTSTNTIYYRPENICLVDTIEDESIDIEKDCFNREFRQNIRYILNDEEYKIIRLFYVERKTIKDISKLLQITTKEVQDIRKKAERIIYNCDFFQDYREKAYTMMKLHT